MTQRTKEYEDYLKSPEWQLVRRAVWERCRGICEHCREWKMEQVHHLTYKNLGAEKLEDVIGLCRDCHEREHKPQPPTVTEYLEALAEAILRPTRQQQRTQKLAPVLKAIVELAAAETEPDPTRGERLQRLFDEHARICAELGEAE